ncbi:sensor histidine kinase [Hyalangium minutum]|uniref:sensor histidine kinase n=1 Tax=Hyalangium minutum TaxID=394096 RepID=UPI0006933E12|nr:ATP-binding protein [Hyalangium minutum]
MGVLFALLLSTSLAASERVKTVLVFVPEDGMVPSIADFTRSFHLTMLGERQKPVTVNIEYLDMGWFQGADYDRALHEFYRSKYREQRPEALVVFADACPFVLKLQQELWPQVPLLAVLNDKPLVEALPESAFIRGNWADLDVPGTVRMALRLLPSTRRVALVLGSSQRELAAWDFVESEVRGAAPDREFIGLRGLTLEQLRQRVHTLPEDTVVILVGFMQDAQGQSLVGRDVLTQLHAEGSPPIFSVHKTMLGSGIVGGALLDYELLGQQAAKRTLQLLKGAPLSSLPTGAFDTNLVAFDDRELQRWHIPDSRLPPGGRVFFREPGLWERYRWQVTVAVGAGLLQAVLILVLLVERRLRRVAQRLNAAVLDSLPGSVAILDRNGVVLRATPAPERPESLGGLPAGKLLAPGAAYLEAFREAARSGHPEVEGVASLLQDVLAGRASEGALEFRGFAPDRWLELRARRLDLPEGGAVAALVDVTARRRAELEARQARDERAHLERVSAVGELGVSIAHELNQPLAAILTNAETAQRLLQRSPTDMGLLREMLQDIIADDKRAGEVIRHMRALLKKEGAAEGTHDLNELVGQVVRLVGNDAQLRGAVLSLRLADTALRVRGDGVQLQQVVLNLIINALDAVGPCPPGERQVWVRTQRTDGHVELAVEDTGVGLSPEVQKRLFEPFFTTKPTGLGMGLSISRSILEVHQGRLQAESRPGRGTVFRCSLPAA